MLREERVAKFSKKFHQLTYFTSDNTVTSVNCTTLKRARKIVELSGVEQDLIVTL